MAIDLIPEDDLRIALRPHQVAPEKFAAAVQVRIQAGECKAAVDPWARLSPFVRNVAALLPLEALAGCSAVPAGTKLATLGVGWKILSFLTLPAASLFLLFAATIYSVSKIRGLRNLSDKNGLDQQAYQAATLKWSWQHLVGLIGLGGAGLILTWVGATWLIFYVYLLSFGLLLFALTTLAKRGLANRLIVGQFCLQGLMFLWITSPTQDFNDQYIHFVDQIWVWIVFLFGLVALFAVNAASLVLQPLVSKAAHSPPMPLTVRLAIAFVPLLMFVVPTVLILASSGSFIRSLFQPATSIGIKHFVESFDYAQHTSASWQTWEIPAQWTLDAKLNPDLTKPRRLLAAEIAGPQNPYILGTAMRVGLLTSEQLNQLTSYPEKRRLLITTLQPAPSTGEIPFLDQYDWVIRAAVLHGDLTNQERDQLEPRLVITLEKSPENQVDFFKDKLRVIKLLEVIDRPVDPNEYREKFHAWMLELQSVKAGGFQRAGGFRPSQRIIHAAPEATAYALELMEIFGVPPGLDVNKVRSYLRPSTLQLGDRKWLAAVSRERLNHLPGVHPPTWFDYLYYERTLLSAIVLVGLCLYATLTSPVRSLPLASNQPCPA